MLQHFENRAAFVVVSPDTPDAQKKFADGRGWQFRMLSNGDSGFTEDMGYVREYQRKMSPQPRFSYS
jgi:peroxiredoxin